MLNSNGLIASAEGFAAAYPYAQVHVSGTPSAPGAEATSDRELLPWDVDGDGDLFLTGDVPFTGGAAGGPAVLIMYHSAATGGTMGGGQLLDTNPPNDTTFNGAGEFTLKAAGFTESNTST